MIRLKPASNDTILGMEPELYVFLDEAGDPGVRDGLRYRAERHEWLCLSAVIVRKARDSAVVDWVRDMRVAANSVQASSLHYYKITAVRRKAVCQAIAAKPIRCFVLASHKSNMREYINPRIRKMLDAGTFYNWCFRLLLERVTAWCEAWQMLNLGAAGPLRLVMAERGGHDYDHLFAYVDKLKMQVETKTLYLPGKGLHPALLDRAHWSVHRAETRAGLQIADTVASAFYQAANTQSPIWDLAPAKALRPIMVANKGACADAGVTVWPLPHQAALPEETRAIFRFYGYGF